MILYYIIRYYNICYHIIIPYIWNVLGDSQDNIIYVVQYMIYYM